ncbi:DNA replication and repair protein RecF [Candidatus Saccharibacteria bacterium]|nr:DNA replication and repair protein RecF [Candidatus Saccharibacteria bacterium]
MTLKRLAVYNIRSYDLSSFEFSPHTTLVLGSNGSGKTSLLEAIYLMYRGVSFRGSTKDILAHTTKNASIRLESRNEGTRALDLTLTGHLVNKKFEVNGKKTFRLPIKNKLPVVLFEPDELRMLSSSPDRRRRFLDGIISRLSPSYASTLTKYQRTLLQRNELLKQSINSPKQTWQSHLFAWDIKLAELASQLVDSRRAFIKVSNDQLSTLYSDMANKDHEVSVRYICQFPEKTYQQQLIGALTNSIENDILKGHTTVGPHRDDFEILLDNYPAPEVASRGELRTIMLAYKLLEVTLVQRQYSAYPLILLDDVFSELDVNRERHLMKKLQPFQSIITATDLRDELQAHASIISL